MSQTTVPTGSALAVKEESVALFAVTQRAPTLMRNLTGPAPSQADAETKIQAQTSPDMPIVRVTNLAKSQGDEVTIDLFNVTGGFPIMGDQNAEGKGQPLTTSSQTAKIDQYTYVVDAGGKMAQQRTRWSLRGVARANQRGYWKRLETQLCYTHLAGARGSQAGIDWAVPKQFTSGTTVNPDFAPIVVNSVLAPTYNRHYVANAAGLTQGGLQLGAISSTDVMKLEHLDELRAIIEDAEVQINPVKIEDDPAAEDEPMWLFLCTRRAWKQVESNTSGLVWRTFLQNAWNRASHGSKHPLFKGEAGMWNNILVKPVSRAIRFLPGENAKVILVANRYTATESDQTVNAGLGAGKAVDRCLLLGAQALANVYGRNQGSDYYFAWHEREYNFGNNLEVAGRMMGGKTKVRFSIPDGLGNNEPTDFGVFAVDVAVSL